MLQFEKLFIIALTLFANAVVAEDIYISGGDSEALQEAINAANVPNSQVTIHLEAGQVFSAIPQFGGIQGSLRIEGNGAVFGDTPSWQGHWTDVIEVDGEVTITDTTISAAHTMGCTFIVNRGSLSLERVTFSDIFGIINQKFFDCPTTQFLLNQGSLSLLNVSIISNEISLPGSVIRSVSGATTNINHLTVVDTTLNRSSLGTILKAELGGPISVSNSIIIAEGQSYPDGTHYEMIPCDGPIIDKGGNFASSGECGPSWGLIERTDLSQIVEKGHDAWVVPLVGDSIAMEAGNPDYCLRLDGRGFERDAMCDSGSYEAMASNHGGEIGRGGISGFYYTPDSDGNYIQVQRAYNGNVVVIWNTFDKSGSQAWVNAVGRYQGRVVEANAYINLGGILQPGAGASEATVKDWGTLKVTAHNCNDITVEYDSIDPNFGSGTFEATRLAFVHDLGCSEN